MWGGRVPGAGTGGHLLTMLTKGKENGESGPNEMGNGGG